MKGNLYLFREALPTFNANPDGGSFIITSSTAVGRLVGYWCQSGCLPLCVLGRHGSGE